MPDKLRALQAFNPAAWYLTAIRAALFDGVAPSLGAWMLMAAAPAALLIVGYRFITKTRSEIRDVL